MCVPTYLLPIKEHNISIRMDIPIFTFSIFMTDILRSGLYTRHSVELTICIGLLHSLTTTPR